MHCQLVDDNEGAGAQSIVEQNERNLVLFDEGVIKEAEAALPLWSKAVCGQCLLHPADQVGCKSRGAAPDASLKYLRSEYCCWTVLSAAVALLCQVVLRCPIQTPLLRAWGPPQESGTSQMYSSVVRDTVLPCRAGV